MSTELYSPGERIYLHDDPSLGILANPDPAVRQRHVDRYREAIRLAKRAPGMWLDCACGSGYGSALVRSSVRRAAVCGVDRDATAIEFANRNYRRRRLMFLQQSVESAMHFFAGERFDVILSIETIEHLGFEVQREWVAWCHDRLKPNRAHACLVMMFPLGNGASETNPYHLHEPTRDEVDELMRPFALDRWRLNVERYESTSGPATQATVVAWKNAPDGAHS